MLYFLPLVFLMVRFSRTVLCRSSASLRVRAISERLDYLKKATLDKTPPIVLSDGERTLRVSVAPAPKSGGTGFPKRQAAREISAIPGPLATPLGLSQQTRRKRRNGYTG